MKNRIIIWYIAAVVTYTVLRIPCAAVLYGFFHQRGEPETIAYLMRFFDPVVYFPFFILRWFCHYLDQFETTQYVLATYYIALVVVWCGWIVVAVFRRVLRFIQVLLQR